MVGIADLLKASALSGTQSYQQSPATIQGLLAQAGTPTPAQQPQQQDISQLDPQQLSDLIQSLQQDGNLPPNPTQQDVQTAASDTMSSGSSEDSVAGSGGNDSMSGAQDSPQQPAPSSINDILNNFSSGRGNVDYEGLQNAYPTPRSPLNNMTPEQLDAMAQNMVHQGSGESGFSALMRQSQTANALGAQQDVAQKNAMATALNSRDVNAYNAMTGMANKEGILQNDNAKTDEEKVRDANTAKYQRGELSIKGAMLDQGRYERAGVSDDGDLMLFDRKSGNVINAGKMNPNLRGGGIAATAKPLDAAKQTQITKGINEYLATRDEDGKITGSIPLDSTQRVGIAAAAGKLYQSGKAATAADAVGQVMDSLGGIPALTDQETPRTGIMSIFGNKSTGMKAFPADSINQVINGPSTSPAATGGAISAAQGGGSAVDKLVEGFMQKHPEATADQVAKVRSGIIAMQQQSGQ